MSKYHFKTNIKCSGCIATITPHLNEQKDIRKWEVDTATADKILTIEGDNLNENQLRKIVEKAGFKAESVHS